MWTMNPSSLKKTATATELPPSPSNMICPFYSNYRLPQVAMGCEIKQAVIKDQRSLFESSLSGTLDSPYLQTNEGPPGQHIYDLRDIEEEMVLPTSSRNHCKSKRTDSSEEEWISGLYSYPKPTSESKRCRRDWENLCQMVDTRVTLPMTFLGESGYIPVNNRNQEGLFKSKIVLDENQVLTIFNSLVVAFHHPIHPYFLSKETDQTYVSVRCQLRQSEPDESDIDLEKLETPHQIALRFHSMHSATDFNCSQHYSPLQRHKGSMQSNLKTVAQAPHLAGVVRLDR